MYTVYIYTAYGVKRPEQTKQFSCAILFFFLHQTSGQTLQRVLSFCCHTVVLAETQLLFSRCGTQTVN